jgi:hypothetical protein
MIHSAIYDELQAAIQELAGQPALFDVPNFVPRATASRRLETAIVSRIDRMLDGADKGERKRLRAVKREALRVRSAFEHANDQLFTAFRHEIQAGTWSPDELRARFGGYVEHDLPEEWNDPPRYDHLDTFVDGVLRVALMPRSQRQPDPEMVLYQPTPARIVLDLIGRLRPGPHDIFYDLGSGLGRVTILTALLSTARSRGVEYEPAYVEYALRRSKELGLDRVEFINADARDVNYADGTVFFLYTPFKGMILQRVLERLRYEAGRRRIRVCTYGPGTLEVMEQGWIASPDEPAPDLHRAAIFVGT